MGAISSTGAPDENDSATGFGACIAGSAISGSEMKGSGSGATYCDWKGVVSNADADAIDSSSTKAGGAEGAITFMAGLGA